MKIQPTGTTPQIPFKKTPPYIPFKGIYESIESTNLNDELIVHDKGTYKGLHIDVYTTSKNGSKDNKLHYLSDEKFHWLKSKLTIFKNNKKVRSLISTLDKLEWH